MLLTLPCPPQKLEDEPSLVSVNMCRAYDGARNEEAPHDQALFDAWCTVSVRCQGLGTAVQAWQRLQHTVMPPSF